jgi:hypothetical protein
MSLTMDLGRRIELVSMDPHFHDISIALYRQETESGPQYVVHSYSQKEGTRERLAFVIRAMHVLGGLEENNGRLYFSCGSPHQLAARRIFLESCKLKPSATLESRPLSILDKKSNIELEASSAGLGAYKVSARDGGPEGLSRVSVLANGLAKLADLARSDGLADVVTFPCGQSHDAVIGLLLSRALNVRAALREEEMASSRGVLAAPSAQQK